MHRLPHHWLWQPFRLSPRIRRRPAGGRRLRKLSWAGQPARARRGRATPRFILRFARWTQAIARNVITANSAARSTGTSFGRWSNMGTNRKPPAQRPPRINEIAFNHPLLSSCSALGPPAPICPTDWSTNYDATLAAAATNQQPALVYFTASWCGPCKLMTRTHAYRSGGDTGVGQHRTRRRGH